MQTIEYVNEILNFFDQTTLMFKPRDVYNVVFFRKTKIHYYVLFLVKLNITTQNDIHTTKLFTNVRCT